MPFVTISSIGEGDGGWANLTFEDIFESGARRLQEEARKRSLNCMLAFELIRHDFASQ